MTVGLLHYSMIWRKLEAEICVYNHAEENSKIHPNELQSSLLKEGEEAKQNMQSQLLTVCYLYA